MGWMDGCGNYQNNDTSKGCVFGNLGLPQWKLTHPKTNPINFKDLQVYTYMSSCKLWKEYKGPLGRTFKLQTCDYYTNPKPVKTPKTCGESPRNRCPFLGTLGDETNPGWTPRVNIQIERFSQKRTSESLQIPVKAYIVHVVVPQTKRDNSLFEPSGLGWIWRLRYWFVGRKKTREKRPKIQL